MAGATVRWNPEVVLGPAEAAFEVAAEAAVEAAREAAPVRTGALRSSIQFIRDGSASGYVAAYAPYAAHQEWGTGPHLITPSVARALASEDGSFGPVAWAGHPGNPGRNFLGQGCAVFPTAFKAAFEGML